MGIAQVLRAGPFARGNSDVLVATETMDDAGVYRLSDDLALVQTLDFFPPLVDDPFTFGQIAAANALSDVYAMNGRPVTVLNIAAFPDDELPMEILGEILRGASDRVALAGAATLGGHTVRDKEIKFGLSVTGLIHPAEILTNAGAQPGDVLVLTKPLGTGFVTTAAKRQECPLGVLDCAVTQMIALNASARDALRAAGGVHAVTDVTGYGLAGHACEMAQGAGLTFEIDVASLPLIEGALPLAVARYYTRASKTNREFLAGRLSVEPAVDPLLLEFVFDAQTSGGLLIAVGPEQADRLVSELQARGTAAAAIVGRAGRGPARSRSCSCDARRHEAGLPVANGTGAAELPRRASATRIMSVPEQRLSNSRAGLDGSPRRLPGQPRPSAVILVVCAALLTALLPTIVIAWSRFRKEPLARPDRSVPTRSLEQARALLKSGRPAAAREVLGAVSSPAANADALELAGIAFEAEGNLDEAERCWRRAVALDPGHGAAWLDLGRLAISRHELREAVSALELAVKLNPGSIDPVYNLSRAYRLKGDLNRAMSLEQQADQLRLSEPPRGGMGADMPALPAAPPGP